MRIVSLVPSVTETLLAWSIEPLACTRFCEQPGLRHVGGTKDPDIESIVRLSPDFVIMDREENRREDAERLTERGMTVIDLHVTSIATAISETRRLAELVGASFEAPSIAPCRSTVRAFVPIWRRPWMTFNASTYGASMLASIGIEGSHARFEQSYPQVSLDELSRLHVDVVLLPTEPYAFGGRHVEEVVGLTGVSDVRIVDGRDLFWWGIRTSDARQRLATQLRDLV